MPDAFDPNTSPGGMSQVTAVVSYMLSGTRTGLGVTKGGASLDVSPKRRDAEYDGRRHRVATATAGTSQIVEYMSSISGTFVEFSEKTVGATLPASTTDAGVITPQPSNVAVKKGDMLELVWYQMYLADGTSLVWEFDYGLVVESNIDTKDKDEASMKLKIDAYVDGDREDYAASLPDFRLDADGNVIV
jgi:hypothetical protein